MVPEGSRQRAPSMIASSSSASSNASYPEEMMIMAVAAAQQQQQQENQHSFASGVPIDLSWQSSSSSSQQPSYYTATTSAIETNPDSFFNNQNHSGANSNTHYYPSSNTRQTYNMMTYPQSNSSIVASDMEAHQPMTMQPALSVYYAHDYGLKQTASYSLMDSNNNMTFIPPPRNSLAYPSFTTVTNGPSPALSPSSSSTSATSSPVHPAYHDTVSSEHGFIQQQRQPHINANALHLLSHHQSLY
jgi:hypothetical protein